MVATSGAQALVPLLLLLHGQHHLTADAGPATFPSHLVGSVPAVAALLERVLPGSATRFELSIAPTCPGVPAGKACFTLADGAGGKTIKVTGTSASELTGGVGAYLREYCNMTIGWPRGGGSRVFTPSPWPTVGKVPVARARSVPYSHVTQVCTHSYTLVWHDWPAWEKFIDWMALAGHNSIVAPTGQEEVQYKVLTGPKFGLTDMQVRNWTNGPGFLTWSRGQNSHGNSIGGPLPRSFMQGQWQLQQLILARYRELGILGHQPAFAGNAPWALAVLSNDSRTDGGGATRGKPKKDFDTAWIDGRDPLYTAVADAWMQQIMSDFGSDHAWQADAFFGNGTGWGVEEQKEQDAISDLSVNPVFLARAKAAYGAIERADGPSARWIYQSWALLDRAEFNPTSLGPAEALSRLHGFSSAVPEGNFILLDMSHNAGSTARIQRSHPDDGRDGGGMWRDPWNGSWGLPFIWTALPDYGGDQGIKGNISEINTIPFAAPPLALAQPGYNPKTQAIGVGYTPEGLDQNPAYYELLQEAAFKTAPEPNVTTWLIARAHRRYGLVAAVDPDVASAWAGIAASGYNSNALVSDSTLVGQLFASDWVEQSWMGFESDRTTPKPALCHEWKAWGSLLAAAPRVPSPLPATFSYDLVDLGREVLSQLTIPVGLNFTSAIGCPRESACHSNFSLSAERITMAGELYVALLRDLDKLLATDAAFLLGPWLQAARELAGNAADCTDTILGDTTLSKCTDFMEWNARAQITTWHPTDSPTNPTPPETNPTWPGTINDYARKQWSGLVSTYYAERVGLYLKQALTDSNLGHRRFNMTAVRLRQAKLAYEWQTDFGNIGAVQPTGDPISVSTELRAKYSDYFASCG